MTWRRKCLPKNCLYSFTYSTTHFLIAILKRCNTRMAHLRDHKITRLTSRGHVTAAKLKIASQETTNSKIECCTQYPLFEFLKRMLKSDTVLYN